MFSTDKIFASSILICSWLDLQLCKPPMKANCVLFRSDADLDEWASPFSCLSGDTALLWYKCARVKNSLVVERQPQKYKTLPVPEVWLLSSTPGSISS